MKSVYVKVFLDNVVIPFLVEDEEDIKFNDYVIIETKYGKDLGKVISGKLDFIAENSKKIISKAQDTDIELFNKNRKKDVDEHKKIRDVLRKYNPEAHFVGCYFLLEGNKVIVNFSAESRIDFRDAVKALASIYKTRIEMRQISPREAFKIMGGIGICGMKCCCTRFNHLKQHVSANLVKEQNLSETNSKVIGPCGKLLCCLVYESHCYKHGKHILYNSITKV